MQLGWHFIKSWSTTQAVVALSSAEAELYALVKGAAQTLGMISVAKDLGIDINAMIKSDASAALGIVAREGLGKLRHINVQYLWIQSRVAEGSINVMKVPGLQNPADLFTKHLAASDVEKFCQDLCLSRHSDRASVAPMLCRISDKDGVAEKLIEDLNFTNEEDKRKAWSELKATGTVRTPDGAVAVVHERPRRQLYTPSRHEGMAPRRAFTGHRETHGWIAGSGEHFIRRDTWSRDKAQPLNHLWTGWTKFFLAS